jgi:dolichol kinase
MFSVTRQKAFAAGFLVSCLEGFFAFFIQSFFFCLLLLQLLQSPAAKS